MSVDAVAARELELFINNDSQLYNQQALPIIKNLTRKKAAGTYDHEKAAKLYKYLADNGARRYGKEFSGSEREGLRIFSPETRRAVARNLRNSFETEYGVGAYNEYIPKKYRKTAAERMEGLRQMFRGKRTEGFHCMTCGRPLPYGRVLCKDCEKMHRRAGTKFEMSSGHRAVDRMESQQ